MNRNHLIKYCNFNSEPLVKNPSNHKKEHLKVITYWNTYQQKWFQAANKSAEAWKINEAGKRN